MYLDHPKMREGEATKAYGPIMYLEHPKMREGKATNAYKITHTSHSQKPKGQGML